jgi:hypothetical protein
MSFHSNASLRGLQICASLLALWTCACAEVAPKSSARPNAPGPGLYEVIDRQCAVAEHDVQECTLIQFVELVHGTFHGVAPEQLAFVVWLAERRDHDRYTYGAIDLRGRRVGSDFVIEQNDRRREWLVMENGDIHEYRIDQRAGLHGEPSSSTRLLLKRVPRTPELADRLRYPDPVPAE